MLQQNDKAPVFSFIDHEGVVRTSEDFLGKQIVLYFYPKDDTPGCTIEACAFRDVYDQLLAAGAVVMGVSPDDEISHEKFRNKYGLPFFLIPDSNHSICDLYGVWGEKQNYGKTYMGVNRTTFIIDGEGRIKKVYPKVKPDGHAEKVLEDLDN